MKAFTPQAIPWLLEEDGSGISYLTLKGLLEVDDDDPRLKKARDIAYGQGFIGKVLKRMKPEGYWVNPGGGYSPKYRSTVWALILLSQLGASIKDSSIIEKACKYYLDHAYSKNESISHDGSPSGSIDCLQGNMCAALMDLGYQDELLIKTYDYMARSEIDKDVRYYSHKSGPNFACGANGKKPCAWGAVKVMLALSKISKAKRTSAMKAAIKKGEDFLLGVEPMTAAYPTAFNTKPNRSWWQFGFPTFYCTDLLQLAEALVVLGYGKDPRLQKTIEFIKSKQDNDGRWALEHDYAGKTWGNFGEKKKPNKWVTYRALKVLKRLS